MKANRGKPPTPPALRISNGTHRDDRHGQKSSIGSETILTEVPKSPPKKEKDFIKWWKIYCAGLIAVGQLSERDLPVIEQLCDAHQLLADTEPNVADVGDHYYATMSGMKRHPAITTIENCRKFIVEVQHAIGFGPAGRAKIPPMVTSGAGKAVQGMNRKAPG